MDDNQPMYKFFQIEKSVSRFWGVGVPYLLRTQSAVLNDSWRNMLDNAAFGAFPLIEVDTSVIQPFGSGPFVINPSEILERQGGAGDRPGLILHHIPINQDQYAAIIELAMRFADMETNISVLASGEQGATSRTAGGMALLMNSVNVVFRRVVKNFDDGVTTPMVTGAYHFLMQYSEKDEIKGDYTIQARGSSVLLVREIQAQNLLLLASQIAQDPMMAKHFKPREIYKKLLQSMMIASDEVLRTLPELQQIEEQERQAQEEAPPPPELLKIQADSEGKQAEIQARLEIAMMERETEMIRLSVQQGISLKEIEARLQGGREQLSAKLQERREQVQSDERKMAAEAAIDGRKADAGLDTGGSGGYFS